jgi:asparagine synthase (glutamine-hydrolysing)
MCGIAGIARIRGDVPVSPEVLRYMCDAIRHRGPDDSGTYLSPDGRTALGHRRLSIVDLSPAGHNPMSNEDGSVWITYNGEVYNHAEWRREMEARGHTYRSHTDTETILHLYEEFGTGLLERLRGMFAFALWDQRRSKLLLVRDRLGIKPLYYTFVGDLLIWASEIKAILEHPGVRRELDEAAFAEYLTFAAVPPPDTLFAGIKKLPAGHFLEMDRQGAIRIERWWTPMSRSPDGVGVPDDDQGTVAAVRGLIEGAVVEQTMADVPHGLLLSGGLDSTLILAILSRALARPVRTFSIGFDDAPGFDEREFSRIAARTFKTDHTELVLPPAEVISSLPELVHAQDEPLSDWVCLPLKALTKAVRDAGVIVVQVGEGSDELFAGYPRYARYARLNRRLWRSYTALPVSVRRGTGAVAQRLLKGSDRLREVRDLFDRASEGLPLFVSGAVVNWDFEKAGLLTTGARGRLGGSVSSARAVARNLEEFRRLSPGGGYLSAMAWQDLAVRLPELLLMRVDKMTMLNSVEARVPFLDHRLVELAFALPDERKLRRGVMKHLVKSAADGLVSPEIIHRRKFGFDVPLSKWLREEPLKSWSTDTILGSALMRRDLLDADHVRDLITAHQSGARDTAFRLWNLVNACAWYDRWIEPR